MCGGTLGRQGQVISGAHWPVSLVELQASERPNHKKAGWAMAQQVRALATRPDDLIPSPVIYTVKGKHQLL